MGLKGEETEEESDEEEEEEELEAEDDKMPEAKAGGEKDSGGAGQNVLPPVPISDVLRFTMTGNRPGG